jgi:hypothetical protein
MTKTDAYIKELKRLGFTPAATASKKFLAFSHPEMKKLIFVGRRCNIRYGKMVSDSMGMPNADELLNHLQRKFINRVTREV